MRWSAIAVVVAVAGLCGGLWLAAAAAWALWAAAALWPASPAEPALVLPIHVRFGDDGWRFPDLVRATQLQVDAELASLGVRQWRLRLVDELEVSRRQNAPGARPQPLALYRSQATAAAALSSRAYSLVLILGEECLVGIDAALPSAFFTYTLELVWANDLPFFVTQTLVHHWFKTEIAFMASAQPPQLWWPARLSVNFVSLPNRSVDWDLAMHTVVQPFQRILHRHANVSVDVQITTSAARGSDFVFDASAVESTDELMAYMAEAVLRVEKRMGIPPHPDNNLQLRLQMVKRVVAMKQLARAARRLRLHALPQLEGAYRRLAGIAAKGSLLEVDLGEWDALYHGAGALLADMGHSDNGQGREINRPY